MNHQLAKRLRTRPITRVRTGCFTCRRRKKRCEEQKPVCRGCMRNKLTCEWPADSSSPHTCATQTVELSPTATTSQDQEKLSPTATTFQDQEIQATDLLDSHIDMSPPLDLDRQNRGSPRYSRSTYVWSVLPLPSPLASPASSAIDAAVTGNMETNDEQQAEEMFSRRVSYASSAGERVPGQELELRDDVTIRGSLMRGISLLPGYDDESYELLNHYLSTTADCMANGSSPINPFLVQIVPLAFASDLLLQLVLTQSAAHRAFRRLGDVDTVAQYQYTKALHRFRRGISEFIDDGVEATPLLLAIGALLMCFTETAKGDVDGTIFDHLSAANLLLLRLVSQPDLVVSKDLKDFVIEYHTYTASVSLVSIDVRINPQALLNFELEQHARQLLNREYVGNLCGCWLELLLLIPCIFDWSRPWVISGDGEQPTMPTADDFAMFASLQGQILRWSPFSWVTPEVSLAGRIFQQAMLLYLYTASSCFQRVENGMYQVMVDSAAAQAMSYLDQLPATVRINSGLCWPIAVVGSCLSDPLQQDRLRCRLKAMAEAFGLGNMRRTLILLEHMWRMPPGKSGPWTICQAMQEHHIWISFA